MIRGIRSFAQRCLTLVAAVAIPAPMRALSEQMHRWQSEPDRVGQGDAQTSQAGQSVPLFQLLA